MSSIKLPIRILFVCLGNICRSPMAQAVFQGLIDENKLTKMVFIDSAGTSANHEGQQYHHETRRVCQQHKLPLLGESRPVQYDDLQNFDYIIAMDNSNYQDLLNLDHEKKFYKKIFRILDFSSLGSALQHNVPDPYYGGPEGFDEVYEIIFDASLGLLQKVRHENNLL